MFAIQPFATIIFEVQNSIFKFDPQGYHFVSIGIHIFNSWLVFFIINKLTNNERNSIIGSLLFATFPIFSETVIWISAQSELWMTAFILLSFFSYLKYNKQNRLIWLIISIIYFGLAILSKQIAIIFIPIYFCFDALFDENLNNYFKESTELLVKVRKIGKYSIKYLPYLIIVIISYTLFNFNNKIYLNNTPYFIFAAFLDFIPNSFFPLFLDNTLLYTILFTIGFFGLIACFYIIFKRKNKLLIFSFIWIISIIIGFSIFNLTSIDIYFYLILISPTTTPQGRFFYIISVGVAIFYSVILDSLYKKKINLKFKLPISRDYVFFSLIIFLLIGNSFLIYTQQDNWKRASRISYNILLKTFATMPNGSQNVNIYYINVPDHINDPLGPSWNTNFIFRNGLVEIIYLFYPNCRIFSFNMIYHKKILDFELSDWRIPISENEFNRFSNDNNSLNVILFFNPVTELLIDVSGLNYTDFDPYPFLGIPKLEYWFK
ncbi:MAG: glycosyltransferase family 39 protein [Candidatus Helarchaeota archaeon]|nr:glycosyltransferase family 39 protein [Candidatus Helarchaeota archaeon]